MQKWTGKPPSRKGWSLLKNLGDFGGVVWHIYAHQRNKNGNPWIKIKVIADATLPRKANYPLIWNGERLARTLEARLLAEREPELHATVLALLTACTIE